MAQTSARVVVIGGGFAGATCARWLKRSAPKLQVTLVEANRTFTACPLSNQVIAGMRDLSMQQFGYDKMAGEGVTVVFARATAVNASARTVTLEGGTRLEYDRLVLAPGIAIRWNALLGYDEAAAERMPHAWIAGAQTQLLRRQLEAMADGGVVVMAVPEVPYRCPPAPYERASLIAHYLKTRKPKSKLLVLDAKDAFSQQQQFQTAWAALYPGLLEWVPLSNDGKVTAIDAVTTVLKTDFGEHKADVANVIPPQQAGAIAALAGVADRTGWCPIDPLTFASTLQPNMHVIGDAVIGGAAPKSASAAQAEGRACAAAVAALLDGSKPAEPRLDSSCYALAAPDYGFSIAGTYRPGSGQFVEIEGSGRTSPLQAPLATRSAEARAADAWFMTITGETFG